MFLSLTFRNIKMSALIWLVIVIVHYRWLLAVYKRVEWVVVVNRKV
jgi:hypothetical protein